MNSYANSGKVKPAAIFSRDTASNPARLRRNQIKREPNHEGHEDHEVQKYNMNESFVAFVYSSMPDNFRQLAQIFGFKILRYSSRQEREARQDSEFILFSLRSLRALREIFRNLVAALPRCALRGESVFSRGFDNLRSGRRCRPTSAATISAARVLREQQIDKPTVFSASGRPNNAAREVAQISPYPLLEILVARAMVLAPLQ